MRLLFVVILLGAVFLGGYQTGRQPNSPDIIGMAKETCVQVDRTVREVYAEICGDEHSQTVSVSDIAR